MLRLIFLLTFSSLFFTHCGMSLVTIPNDFLGNFYDKSGKEYWAHGEINKQLI